jgi:DNA-binding LytR/AlgR family response regulator
MTVEQGRALADAPLRVIFCDSDSAHIKQYAVAVQQVCSVRGVPVKVLYYPTGAQLIADLERNQSQPVVVIAEAELPDQKGIEALRKIREREMNCQIIIFSKTPAYALEGYEVDAIAYLLKGATPLEVLMNAFARALSNVYAMAQQYITFSCAGYSQTVRLVDILYFEVVRKIVTVHYKEGEFDFYSTLGTIQNTLEGYGFVRTHRNYVVSLSKIARHENDEVILDSGVIIPIGRNYRKDIKAALKSLDGLSVV